MKKVSSAIYSRGDGAEFALATYATDTGFSTEWSCKKCSLSHKCETKLPDVEASFKSALAEVNAHQCGG